MNGWMKCRPMYILLKYLTMQLSILGVSFESQLEENAADYDNLLYFAGTGKQ